MSKICPKCATENQDDYLFCKKCGNRFYQAAPAPVTVNRFAFEEYDGVPANDMAEFIGPNSDKIMNKFTNMKLAESKVSWCWPVAVLSFLFGAFGAAIWFLYRKMYKVAAICLAVGLVLSIGKACIMSRATANYFAAVTDSVKQTITEIENEANTVLNSETEVNIYRDFLKKCMQITDKYYNEAAVGYASLLQTVERYVSAIIFDMFAMRFYKNHIVKKIKLCTENPEKYTFKKLGGKSSGLAVLGVLVIVFSTTIMSVVGIITYLFI